MQVMITMKSQDLQMYENWNLEARSYTQTLSWKASTIQESKPVQNNTVCTDINWPVYAMSGHFVLLCMYQYWQQYLGGGGINTIQPSQLAS